MKVWTGFPGSEQFLVEGFVTTVLRPQTALKRGIVWPAECLLAFRYLATRS